MMQNQAIKFSTLQKKEIKNIKQCLRRKNVETIEKLKSDWERVKKKLQSSAKDDTLVKENESIESMPLIVTKALWGHMSPSSRTKVKKKWLLKEQKKGMNLKIRKELGVNLSNSFKDERKNGTTNSHRKLF